MDKATRRQALDGAARRRVYLFRHGAVDYVDANGNVVADTGRVSLNARGVSQAEAMRELFDGVHVDRAVCSGLPRTRQTAETVLRNRGLQVEANTAFEEIRQRQGEPGANFDILADVAFTHWRAGDAGQTFLGGERYSDFYRRIEDAVDSLLADASWQDIAIFAHGGTNAAVLGWVMDIGLSAFGLIDQATCCLNVIDIDVDDSGKIVRKTVRAMNVTAYDPAKGARHSSDMESMAGWLTNRHGQL